MDQFKNIIKFLTPSLKEMGFDKKGNNFYIKVNNNYGIVNFQNSKESTKSAVKFTINFGVYSDMLGKVLDYNYNIRNTPDVYQCQWGARVGYYMPGSPDFWWVFNITDDLNSICTSVLDIVNEIIIPEISKRITDEGLLNCWLNNSYYGTTEIGRFKGLTTLLKVKGDFDNLNKVIEVFMQQSKGKQNASMANEHLKEIEYGN